MHYGVQSACSQKSDLMSDHDVQQLVAGMSDAVAGLHTEASADELNVAPGESVLHFDDELELGDQPQRMPVFHLSTDVHIDHPSASLADELLLAHQLTPSFGHRYYHGGQAGKLADSFIRNADCEHKGLAAYIPARTKDVLPEISDSDIAKAVSVKDFQHYNKEEDDGWKSKGMRPIPKLTMNSVHRDDQFKSCIYDSYDNYSCSSNGNPPFQERLPSKKALGTNFSDILNLHSVSHQNQIDEDSIMHGKGRSRRNLAYYGSDGSRNALLYDLPQRRDALWHGVVARKDCVYSNKSQLIASDGCFGSIATYLPSRKSYGGRTRSNTHCFVDIGTGNTELEDNTPKPDRGRMTGPPSYTASMNGRVTTIPHHMDSKNIWDHNRTFHDDELRHTTAKNLNQRHEIPPPPPDLIGDDKPQYKKIINDLRPSHSLELRYAETYARQAAEHEEARISKAALPTYSDNELPDVGTSSDEARLLTGNQSEKPDAMSSDDLEAHRTMSLLDDLRTFSRRVSLTIPSEDVGTDAIFETPREPEPDGTLTAMESPNNLNSPAEDNLTE